MLPGPPEICSVAAGQAAFGVVKDIGFVWLCLESSPKFELKSERSLKG